MSHAKQFVIDALWDTYGLIDYMEDYFIDRDTYTGSDEDVEEVEAKIDEARERLKNLIEIVKKGD